MSQLGDDIQWEQKLEGQVTCPICEVVYEDPKILKCHHTFCGRCMEKFIRTCTSVDELFCPICRAPFKQEEVTSSFFVKKIVELYRERHSLPAPNPRPRSPADPGPHRSRSEVITVHEAARQSVYDDPEATTFINKMAIAARDELQKISDSLRDDHNSVLSALDTLESTKQEFQAKYDTDSERVKDFFGRLRSILDSQEAKSLSNLFEITTSALKMLGQQTYDLSDLESQLKSCNAALSDLLESKNLSRIVEMERRVTVGATDLIKSVQQAKLRPVCVPNTNTQYANLEEFAKNCETLCYVYTIPHPSNCAIQFVTDDGRPISVTEPITVSVDLRDIHSNPVMNQSDRLELSSDQGDSFVESTTVKEVTPGVYDVCYFPRIRNEHKVDVSYVDIYSNSIVVATADIPSLLAFDYETNEQRIVETYGSKRKKFDRPCGLALGPSDEIIVSDRGNHQLIVFDSQQQFLHVIGQKGSGNGEFNWPNGITVDAAGLIYVADRHNNRIQKVRLDDGTFVSKIGKKGTGNGEFKEPRAVALTSRNLLYVADGFNHRVQVFKEEKFIFSFGRHGSGPCEFDVPASIAFNQSEDKIFVSDNRNDRVQVFTIHGEYIQTFGDSSSLPYKLKWPHGVYRSIDGHILISCSGHAVILVFKEDGTFVKAIKELIDRPGEVAINSKGQLIATNYKGLVISEKSLESFS